MASAAPAAAFRPACSIRCGAADNLIENNIARYMNKPIMFNVSGGGNVIAYNHADNSWATPAAWQEVNVDTHCAFPHMELMEGNWAPHMGATITHGNAGAMTYFRNYASSQFAPPAVAGSTAMQTSNITALQFDAGDVDMTVIGNVLGSAAATSLGTAPVSATYVGAGPDTPSIFELGDNANHNGAGMADVAYTTLVAHGNYDTVTAGVSGATRSPRTCSPRRSTARPSRPGGRRQARGRGSGPTSRR